MRGVGVYFCLLLQPSVVESDFSSPLSSGSSLPGADFTESFSWRWALLAVSVLACRPRWLASFLFGLANRGE